MCYNIVSIFARIGTITLITTQSTTNTIQVFRGTDPLAAFAEFLRIDVANGDASPETIRTYYGRIRMFVAWCAERGIDPALASPDNVKQYRSELIAQGLTRSTVAAKLNSLRRFYDMAVERGWRPDNPVKGIRAPADRTERMERVKRLPAADLQRLLTAPDRDTIGGRRDRAILAMMALHGLRVVEAQRLTLADLDMEAGTLAVRGKGEKRCTLILVDPSKRILEGWLAVRNQIARCDVLFVSRKLGYGMSRRGIRKIVDGYLEDLGLKEKGVSCHSLRHSFATLSRAGGAKLDAISKALGHGSVNTTQIYADIVDREAENPTQFLINVLR